MLVTIAAAAVALASAERPAAGPQLSAADRLLAEARPQQVCRGAARVQTAYEPALLYRRSDTDRIKKLIEMPMAQGCLLGGTR